MRIKKGVVSHLRLHPKNGHKKAKEPLTLQRLFCLDCPFELQAFYAVTASLALRLRLAFDKEILFQCLLEEVQACGVEVLPGINVDKVTTLDDRVRVEGNETSFDASYVIAADGVNSRVAQVMGFNENRTYYCNVYGISYYMSGLEFPETDVVMSARGFLNERGATLFVVPRAIKGEYITIVLTVDPGVNLEEAGDYFMAKKFWASWFKKAKKSRTLSAVCSCYSPIVEPFRGRVLVVGDAGSTQELENTGAMLTGWKAGQAISSAVREQNLGLETSGISRYVKWWQDTYVNYYSQEDYLKGAFGTHYILTTEEEMEYISSFIKETLPACWNPYSSPTGQAMAKAIPVIQRERPEILQKLQRKSLPASQIFAEVTKTSKPVS